MRLLSGSLIALGLVASGFLLAYFDPAEAGGGGACHEPLTDGNVSEVAIFENCFGPTVARVAVGDTLTWTNHDSVQHNVYPPGQGWSDGHPLYKSNTTSAIFEAAGVYPYICSVHPGMVGVVVVGDGMSVTAQAYELKELLGVTQSLPVTSTARLTPETSLVVAAAASAPDIREGDGGWTLAFAGIGAVASALGLAAVGLVAVWRR